MAATASSVAYRVRLLPQAHQLVVTMSLAGVRGGPLFVAVPTWVPGAYGFMKYGRDLIDVRASASGRDLAITRDGWQGFTIADPPENVEISYRAGAYDPAWGELAGLVDHDQAVLLGTRYLHLPGHAAPVRVRYELPENWPLHHPAGARRIDANTFEYPSFPALLDTPVVTGRFDLVTRDIAGTPFHVVFLDRAIGLDREQERLIGAIEKIALGCRDLFGSFPFDSYTFVFSFDPTAHWGLEHANATMIALDPLVFLEEKGWCDAVRVIAHELFHAWNVCRLKPHPLGTPDFVHGSFPDALWVAEGFTRWYEFVLCSRAGLLTPKRALANVVNYFRHLAALPAYARTTAADSSRATFLNHNRYPGAVNATIDYYDKGMLIAFDLDAALRLHAESTLDRELRAFYEAFVATGFSSDDAIRFFGERSPAVRDLLQREVHAPGGLATPLMLEALGFELVSEEVPALGLVLKDDKGPLVADVLDDLPAGRSGLAAGDEILRIDGFPFHAKALRYQLAHGSRVSLEVKRGARQLRFDIPVGTRREITKVAWKGSNEQLDRLRGWLSDSLVFTADEVLDLSAYDNFHGIQKVL